ncbi:phosphopantetheine-binding protein [Streptomyces hyaluromycini]|uniref:phosphopantetheine-binding protein n=1 Tax=Streptomyces hyaluromycini TaxID=1377993 RepID=UPI00142E5D42|nr:phosphopantetheine-binding protein [Streptomyces hyaluromycini]
MTHDEIWEVLCRHVRDVLGDLQDDEIHPRQKLRDLGANSLDRMDILVGTVDELRLTVPTGALAAEPTLGGLAELLHAHCEQP